MNGFYPGHLKWDYAYSIGQLRPDVVFVYDFRTITPYLVDYRPVLAGPRPVYVLRELR